MTEPVIRPPLSRLASLIRFAAAPTFLGLAAINFTRQDAMSAFMVATCRYPARDLVESLGLSLPEGVSAALGSMWLMYLVMAIFHSSAWLEAMGAAFRRAGGR